MLRLPTLLELDVQLYLGDTAASHYPSCITRFESSWCWKGTHHFAQDVFVICRSLRSIRQPYSTSVSSSLRGGWQEGDNLPPSQQQWFLLHCEAHSWECSSPLCLVCSHSNHDAPLLFSISHLPCAFTIVTYGILQTCLGHDIIVPIPMFWIRKLRLQECRDFLIVTV